MNTVKLSLIIPRESYMPCSYRRVEMLQMVLGLYAMRFHAEWINALYTSDSKMDMQRTPQNYWQNVWYPLVTDAQSGARNRDWNTTGSIS